MYEFELNYTKLHNLGIFGIPVPVQVAFCWHVPVQVGHVPVQVGLWWPVPVQPCFGTGTGSGICPDLFLFATFGTISLYTTSIIHIPQNSSWNSSKNNSIILVLVVWNFIPQNPR